MINKLLILLGLFFSFNSFGQKLTNSPFSSIGIGDFESFTNPAYGGIGSAHTAAIDSFNVNYFNPSSYAFLAQGQPLFSTGISSRFSNYTEGENTFKTNVSGINHFVLGIPFARNFGLAFGVKPFAKTGYSISEKSALGNNDTINYLYAGSGSLNQAFTGFSIKALNLRNHKIGFGSNFGYVFGSNSNERISNLISQESGGIEENKLQIKSIYYDFGLNYILTFNKTSRIILAGTYAPSQNLSGTKDFGLFYALDVTDIRSVVDTISQITEKGYVKMPSITNVGFSYIFRPKVDSSFNKVKIFQLSLFGSYTSTNWENYKTNFTSEKQLSLLNSQKYSAGIEFIPHYNYYDRSKSIGYLSRIRYKIGAQYATLPLERLGKQLLDKSVHLGFSFPIVSQRSVSSLNLSLSAGNRGNGETGSLNEKYYGINFGISIAPGVNDRWFRKYKID